MEKFEINFDNAYAVYTPGQSVTGNVTIRNEHSLNALSLKICIHGEAVTFWKKYNDSRKFDRQGKLQVYSEHINFKSKVIYLKGVSKPWSSLDGCNKIPAGENIFPFFFPLPTNCPPSFEGKYGSIQYAVHIELDRPWRFNAEVKRVFSVIPIVDLMSIPKAINPMVGSACKHFGFFGAKEVKMKVHLPKRGYIPGEVIPILVKIDNHAKKPIFSAVAKLIQHVHCTAQREHSHLFPQEHCHKHCDHKTGQVTVAETFRSVRVECCTKQVHVGLSLTVPPVTVPSFKTPLIEVDYVVAVKLEEKLECEMPLVVGTVPIQAITTRDMVPVPPPEYDAPPEYVYRGEQQPSAPEAEDGRLV